MELLNECRAIDVVTYAVADMRQRCYRDLRSLVLLTLGVFSIGGANAGVVIDFNNLNNATSNVLFTTYSEDGFTITNSVSGSSLNNALLVWARNSPNNADNSVNGGTLSSEAIGQTNTLSKTGGGTFTFNSIDLGDVLNGAASIGIDFVFNLSGGSTSVVQFTTDSVAGLQLFTPTAIDNVVSFSWSTSSNISAPQIDNIVLDGGVPPTGVPEPTSLALVGLALGGLGLCRRRVVAKA